MTTNPRLIRLWLLLGLAAALMVRCMDPIPAIPHPARQHVSDVVPPTN